MTVGRNIVPFIDRKPSWVLIKQQSFEYPFTRTWKALEPDVQFSMKDVQRMLAYMGQLYVADPVVNFVQMPDYSELFGEIICLSSDGEESNNGEGNEMYTGDEYTAAEIYQMWPSRDPWMEEIIRREKEKKETELRARVIAWMN